MNANDTGTVRLELAVRTLAPSGSQKRQEATIQRLDALQERGVVDELAVSVWGKRVGLSTAAADTDPGREVLAAVDSFRSWADDHGLSLGPFFETRSVDSGFTGESYRVLELPSMVLAEYHDDELHWVSPCVDGDSTYAVADRLEMLESRGSDRADARPDAVASPVAEE